MAEKMATLWLYLGRRDKTATRLLAIVQGKDIMATRIDNLDVLNLPITWQSQINQIVYDNRMLWELWIEAADTYEDLRTALKMRGYNNIPVSGQPELKASNMQKPEVNLSSLPKKTTMLRKGN